MLRVQLGLSNLAGWTSNQVIGGSLPRRLSSSASEKGKNKMKRFILLILILIIIISMVVAGCEIPKPTPTSSSAVDSAGSARCRQDGGVVRFKKAEVLPCLRLEGENLYYSVRVKRVPRYDGPIWVHVWLFNQSRGARVTCRPSYWKVQKATRSIQFRSRSSLADSSTPPRRSHSY